MTWKDRLRSHLLFRNILADLIGISAPQQTRHLPPISNTKLASTSLIIFYTSPQHQTWFVIKTISIINSISTMAMK